MILSTNKRIALSQAPPFRVGLVKLGPQLEGSQKSGNHSSFHLYKPKNAYRPKLEPGLSGPIGGNMTLPGSTWMFRFYNLGTTTCFPAELDERLRVL